jgi:hypothetical protein
MTTQEAIETLKLMQGQVEWDYPMEYAVAVDMAVDALKKKIPMKPIKQGTYEPVLCPSCGAWLSTHHGDGYFTCAEPDYCYNEDCHQALDWKVEE